MKKISIAVIYEIVPIFIVVNFFFIFLMIMEQMVQLAELLFVHSVPFIIITKVFICYMPSFFVITVPISMLLSILLAFSRFSSDSELIAMYACGAGKKDLIKPVVIFGLIIVILTTTNSTFLLPRGTKIAVDILNGLLQNLSVNNIREKEMYKDIEGLIFYADKKIDNANFKDIIFIYSKQNAVVTSRKAKIVPNKNKSIMMELESGKVSVSEGDNKYTTINFEQASVNFPLNISVSNMPKSERLMGLDELKANFNKEPAFKYEYHKRFSMPLSNLIMAIFGFYLGIFFQRSGRSLGLVTASILAIVYNVLYVIGGNFVNIINPAIIAWIPNLILTVILSVVVYRSENR